MKIKTREQRIAEYNAAYPVYVEDAVERVRLYFEQNGLDLDAACAKAAAKATNILDRREYQTISLILREYPTETPRPRTFNGHTFSPNAAANKQYFERAIHKVVDTLKLISTPAEVTIDAYLEMPRNVPPDEVILFEAGILDVVQKPDGDNLAKAYLDMVTDVLTIDDDLFYKTTVTKHYSLQPRVEMRITFLKANESIYIYKKLKNRKSVKQAQEAGLLELSLLDYDV